MRVLCTGSVGSESQTSPVSYQIRDINNHVHNVDLCGCSVHIYNPFLKLNKIDF